MGSPLFSARLLTAQTPLQTLSTLRLCSSFCWPSAPWLLLRRPSTRVPMSNSSTLTATTRLLTTTPLPLPSKPSNTPPLPSNTWLPPSKPSNMLLLTPTNTELILTLPLTSPTLSNLFCPLPTALIPMVLILMVPTHTVTPSPLKKRRKKNRFPQLFQSYTRSTTSRIFTTNQTYQHEKNTSFLTYYSSINCIDYALTSLMDEKK